MAGKSFESDIERLLLKSFEWSAVNNKKKDSVHAVECEKCMQHGLMLALSTITGESVHSIRKRLDTLPKKKVVRRKVKRKVSR